MSVKISIDEWVTELERIQKEQFSEEGFTCKEFTEAMKCGPGKARDALAKLIQGGRVMPVTVIRKSVLTGVSRPIPGYKLTGKKS
jgi:hypothetical protein